MILRPAPASMTLMPRLLPALRIRRLWRLLTQAKHDTYWASRGWSQCVTNLYRELFWSLLRSFFVSNVSSSYLKGWGGTDGEQSEEKRRERGRNRENTEGNISVSV